MVESPSPAARSLGRGQSQVAPANKRRRINHTKKGSYHVISRSMQLAFALLRTSILDVKMASSRSQPLSIETLLQKQKDEKEAAAKVCINSLL